MHNVYTVNTNHMIYTIGDIMSDVPREEVLYFRTFAHRVYVCHAGGGLAIHYKHGHYMRWPRSGGACSFERISCS